MLYFLITKNDSVKNINVRKCECSFAFEEIFSKIYLIRNNIQYKNENPGALTSVLMN
jgi:hypothetical protein